MANPWDINQQAAQARQAELMAEGARLTLEKMRLEVEALKLAIESNTAQAVYWRGKHEREDQGHRADKKPRESAALPVPYKDYGESNPVIVTMLDGRKEKCGTCKYESVSIGFVRRTTQDETHYHCDRCGTHWYYEGMN